MKDKEPDRQEYAVKTAIEQYSDHLRLNLIPNIDGSLAGELEADMQNEQDRELGLTTAVIVKYANGRPVNPVIDKGMLLAIHRQKQLEEDIENDRNLAEAKYHADLFQEELVDDAIADATKAGIDISY